MEIIKNSTDLKKLRNFFIKNTKLKLIVTTIFIYSLLLVIAFFCCFQLLFYFKPHYKADLVYTIKRKVVPILNDAQFNFIPSFNRGKTEVLRLNIKFKHYQKLANKRENAIQSSMERDHFIPRLIKTDEDWVPANIDLNGKAVKVKVRLKGRLADHWISSDMWSLNVKVKGENTILGMKKFSLQHPKVRGFLNEWVTHQLLKFKGLISIRYKFVYVSINGQKKQLYALEEGFDKSLIENNQLREGPIFKINNDYDWVWGGLGLIDVEPTDLDIQPYGKNKINRSPQQKKMFNVAKNRLEAFRNKELITSDVFDGEKLAKFAAIMDLLGHHHGIALDNLRFYYNPITDLIEPIGYDIGGYIPLHHKSFYGERALFDNTKATSFYELLMNDLSFQKEYIRQLEWISNPKILTTFFQSISDEYENELGLLKSNYWYIRTSPENIESILKENQTYIQEVLFKDKKMVQAYLHEKQDDEFIIEVLNTFRFPVEIISILINDKSFLLDKSIVLQPRIKTLSPDYKKVPLKGNFKNVDLQSVKVEYHIYGGSKTFREDVFSWPRYSSNLINNHHTYTDIDRFSFLKERSNAIVVETGSWVIDEPLIIEKNKEFIMNSGTEIKLVNGAFILSYSPVKFKGNAKNPIRISSNSSQGSGIAVINAKKRSSLEWVYFNGLSAPQNNVWSLTGAVTFYESPALISHCKFSDNKSEDALNIFRSYFSISHSDFENTFSDAFDGDFVTGDITHSRFRYIGNDAIDVSGSS
ncbi:hypothetical protein DID76_04715, partial [Candidatus Marinamargulisbacteria bacterium SCGC AG-414-C22]